MFDALLLAQEIVPVTDPGSLKIWAYAGFIGLVFVFLALDLGVFHREAHEVSFKEAAGWSAVWLTCGVAFTGFVYWAYSANWLGLGLDTPMYNTSDDPTAQLIIHGTVSGRDAATHYLTGYIVEKSLAMDNIFVISLIFSFFAIPAKYQHRVLFWGILGALVMRGAMIFVGAKIIEQYQWILIVFGGFLVVTAVKMALIKGNDDPSQNVAVRLISRYFPVAPFVDGPRFFTRRTLPPTYTPDPKTGKPVQDPPPEGTLRPHRIMTPLFLTLILVEITDLVFAVDSIPAIFSVTPDPFLVFTSNIFAILGLRSLYFCLAALIRKFRFLKPALILILAIVGVKLLLFAVPPYLGYIGLTPHKSIKVDPIISLVAVLATLTLATILSIVFPLKPDPTPTTTPPPTT